MQRENAPILASDIVADSQLSPDKDELLQTIEPSLEKVKEAITAGSIKDAKTLIALNYCKHHSKVVILCYRLI